MNTLTETETAGNKKVAVMPYRCRTCQAQYPSMDAAEASWCRSCDERICGTCLSECACCGGNFCRECLTSCDYGEGRELNCAECVKMLAENTPKCDSCNRPRTDLVEREDRDDSVGYHEVEQYCADCRALAVAREFFDLSPVNVVEMSEIAFETVPF